MSVRIDFFMSKKKSEIIYSDSPPLDELNWNNYLQALIAMM